VVAFLSQDWLASLVDATSDLEPAEGATALVQHVVTGKADYYLHYEDGRVVEAAIGKPPGDPDLVFTLTPTDAVRLGTGELDLSAAYMQGTLKAEGNMKSLFALLPATHRPEYKAAVTAVAEATDF